MFCALAHSALFLISDIDEVVRVKAETILLKLTYHIKP